MLNFYPTREFIIKNPVKHRRDVLVCVSKWRTSNKHHKYNQIKQLLHQLAKIYGIKITVMHNDKARSATCYIKEEAGVQTIATITLNNNSIISALHEFAHARYGRSESIACRWSIWLFKKTFPEAMEKLVWDGHMLKRKNLDARKKSSTCELSTTELAKRTLGFA